MNNDDDSVSAKDAYEHMINKMGLEPGPTTEEKTALQINAMHFPEDLATRYRETCRILSKRRNMPIGTWSNTAGGVHCGFFLLRRASFKELDEYGNAEWEELRLKEGFGMVVSMLKEMDPDGKYMLYWFE